MFQTRYEKWLERVGMNKRKGKGIDLLNGLLTFNAGTEEDLESAKRERELYKKKIMAKERELILNGKVVYLFVGGAKPLFDAISTYRMNRYADLGGDLIEDIANRMETVKEGGKDTILGMEEFKKPILGISYCINNDTGNKRAKRLAKCLFHKDPVDGDLLYVALPAYIMVKGNDEELLSSTEDTEEVVDKESPQESPQESPSSATEIVVKKTKGALMGEAKTAVLDTDIVDSLYGEELYNYIMSNRIDTEDFKFGSTNIMNYLLNSIGTELANDTHAMDIMVHTSVQVDEQLLYI